MRHNADVPGLVQLYARLSAEATEADHAARPFFTERFRMFREMSVESIREGQRRHAPRRPDPEKIASLLLAAADGLHDPV